MQTKLPMTKNFFNFMSKWFLIAVFLIGVFGIQSHPGAARQLLQEAGPTYIVQQGDTLNEIAIRFGLSAEDILSANAIDNPNALFIGQRILIPGLEGITGVLTSTVLPLGASLTGLGRQFGLDQEDLVRLNRLTSPSEVIAGVAFIVPVDEDQELLMQIPAAVPGETALESAIRAGVSPWLLVANNHLKATWDMLSGETLFTDAEPQAAELNQAETISLSMNQLPVIQGETLQVTLTGPSGLQISGRFNGNELRFFSQGNGVFHSFHGVHALAEPGVYPLEINTIDSEGLEFRFDQLVLLIPGFYGTQMVYVSPEFLDDEVIEDEDAYFFPLVDRYTPVKHWEGRFQYPVDEPCVNSPYGLRRIYNDGLLFFYHTGMDFRVCAQNLNIYAPAAGEVILVEELTIRGKSVLIDHGWGVISGYWHLSEFNVEAGDFVQPGDLLGLIGNTGRSAGPHLHFEILISGTPVNPQTWLDRTFP
jgi:murein DD-endopeptidase MepM/ murein hydrolase activator NlpD